MDSCDTLVLTGEFSPCGTPALAKNSDRPLGEAQPLCFFPAGEGKYAVLGSRPYWMDGFEMGANEKGLFIGNEAEGSRFPQEAEEGLTGMAILRRALETCATCDEAVSAISQLLRENGQNANAHPTADRRYENTFILADSEEAWVMETAGREWAAKKVSGFAAVSNCYSIEEDFELCSKGLEPAVLANRWLRPGEKFNFAKAVTAPADRQRNSVTRMRRMQRLVHPGMDAAAVQAVLRDHFETEINEPRFGAAYGGFVSICMHALTLGLDSSQTAASMLMLRDEQLGLKFLWAPSVPCTSCYIPVYWLSPGNGNPSLPPCLSAGDRSYNSESLWWTMEALYTFMSVDEERFGGAVREALNRLEQSFILRSLEAEEQARGLIQSGDTSAAEKLLAGLTFSCAGELLSSAQILTGILSMEIRKTGGLYGPRKELLEEYIARAGMPL